MSETALSKGRHAQRPDADNRRWRALFFIALAQLMVVLDATIVNIALPSAQHDLGISDGNRQWVITAYALAFGGLLLFGGRIADLWGRKRAFVTGLGGFALASAVGGAAQNEVMMLSARALQGAFGALLAPAALSLLAVMFTDAKERAKAFGIYGAIAGGGGAVGLILGGFLTEYLDWRWTFFVNVPFAIVAAAGAFLVIREPAGGRNRSPLDIPGVIMATLGLVSLVYGFTHAESSGWTDPVTLGLFVASAVLLVAFGLTESKVRAPLLPLRVVADRNRAGVYLSLGLAIIGMFGLFLFLTYYLQVVKGYSPVETGFAFLPMIAGMITGSTQIGARLMTRVAPRLLMGPGFLAAALGMLLLTQLAVDTSYAGLLLPAMLLLGLGMGTAFMPAMSLATHGVEPRDAGVASAMVNTSQQVGGAIGTALLNTIAASATGSYLAGHAAGATTGPARQLVQLQGMVHGYTSAIWVATGILLLAALIALTFVTTGRPGTGAPTAAGSTGGATRYGSAGREAADEVQVPVIAH
ncbi:MFS transporter [Streptomyces sulfonofaciens]|uniref:MFS transporter n=1 Tax=Streptomyces sulfonofaciens TaxID=68272 RepID=A0A919G8Y3_9ACTN|nr:MFS transporter [Streptomyces sulfonofaciens]GHH80210.1 MFS transporter [Streptomyces sulfonofaciens]